MLTICDAKRSKFQLFSQDTGISRLDQLDLRQSQRARFKRPAACSEAKAAEVNGSSEVTERPVKRGRGPKAKPSKPKKAMKAKPKRAMKAKPKRAMKAKPKRTMKAPRPKAKATAKNSKSAKATFARRVQSGKEPMATFWQSLRMAFEEIVQPVVRSPSRLED